MLETWFTCSRAAMEAGKRPENWMIVTVIPGGAILLARRTAGHGEIRLWANAFKDSTLSDCFSIPEGSAKLAPGRDAIATTSPGLASQKYSTPEWVAEGADVRGDADRSCTPSGVRMFWISNRGGRLPQGGILDPRLMSVIPTGIKTAAFPFANP